MPTENGGYLDLVHSCIPHETVTLLHLPSSAIYFDVKMDHDVVRSKNLSKLNFYKALGQHLTNEHNFLEDLKYSTIHMH